MTHDVIHELTTEFLGHYQDKNLFAISEMFTEDVILRDWNYEVSGKTNAVAEYHKNFSEAASIKITIRDIYFAENSAAAELEVVINENILLNVVDVFRFSDQGKICSVAAYKGY